MAIEIVDLASYKIGIFHGYVSLAGVNKTADPHKFADPKGETVATNWVLR
jgi:hypothetical protein